MQSEDQSSIVILKQTGKNLKMSVNLGVVKYESLKPWDTTCIRENVRDLEGLRGKVPKSRC